MKKALYFLTLILMSISVGDLFAQQVPELMYYKFSNNTSTTTQNFASAPVGTVQAPYTGNVIGTGGQFDSCMIGTGATGTNGILPGWNCNLGSSQWTIGFWVKDLVEVLSGSPVYLFGDPGSTSFRCFYAGFALPNNLILRGPIPDLIIPCQMPGSHYIHFVYNGSSIAAYDNGVLISTTAASINMATGTGFRVAGYTGGAYALNSGGRMDEFRLYNRALSAAEVAATWNVQLGSAYPLNAFNLLTPAANARVVTVAGSTTPVTITWDTSAGGANYKWVFGNPVVPPRRLTIPSTSNIISTTLGALDGILAANGFTNNGSATDSAVGQWNVWAFKGSGATGPDSLVSANGPRAITLRRQQVSLNPFALVAPPTGARIITSPVDPSLVTVSWNRSAAGANYKWLFKTGATYTDPATLRLTSNNNGLDTILTLRNSQIDSVLAGLGIAPGDSAVGTWRVRAYATTDSLNSTAPDRSITFRRLGLLPLDQDFVDINFPPPFWGLDAGGGTTQYWTRNAIGGYQTGTGSAKYDFWTAGTATPLQTLTSNQFPPVAAPNNYLRFNYSQAYYLSGTTLAPDSCIIETSTNNGGTWTRLIGMGASTTLSSGTNSSPIMSTVASQAVFTPGLASDWGTKVYAMPVGTNKVRFVAKSGFGNNLYIDRITSGIITGVNSNEITLIPDKFELSQNYPNPFNPVTKINFSIPKQSPVTLKVYDMLGKEVVRLVNELKSPGRYTVSFDASNFASGVYFYKIEAGDFKEIKKMMLIK